MTQNGVFPYTNAVIQMCLKIQVLRCKTISLISQVEMIKRVICNCLHGRKEIKSLTLGTESSLFLMLSAFLS